MLVGHAHDATVVTSFEAEVDRLAALAPAEPSHVIGYSLGARLALGLALRHPERVARLTLVSGSPGLESEAERSARRAADAAWIDLLLGRGLEAFVDAWQALPLWASQSTLPAEQRAEKRYERLGHDPAGLCRSLRATGLAEMPDYWPRLAEVGVPVRVLAGALDSKFEAIAQRMAKQLPRSTLEVVPRAGHDLLLERPDLITEVIRRGY